MGLISLGGYVTPSNSKFYQQEVISAYVKLALSDWDDGANHHISASKMSMAFLEQQQLQ